MRELIEGLAAQKNNQAGSAAQKIGDLYNMAMDSVTLNKQGAEPVKAMLDKIAGMKDKSEIVPMMTEMAHIGIGTYFHSYVYADPKNSSLNIFQMGQGGINWVKRNIIWIPTASLRIFVNSINLHRKAVPAGWLL